MTVRSNGFDTLRLLAAFMVMWGHGFVLHGDGVGYGFGFEHIGLCIFFLISGHLVTQSWQRDPHLLRFMARRALRIMPALAVVVFLTAFALGPFVTSLPTDAYLRDGDTWAYLRWAVFLPRSFQLPGVFPHNAGAGVANGSLWSLPLEAVCYALVAAAGLARTFTRLFAAIAFAAASWGAYRMGGPILPPLACFAGGALLATCGARVSIKLPAPPVDMSYGVYLYAYPLQQTIVMLFPHWSAIACFAAAVPLVLVPAYASWRLVEAPALRLKPHGSRPAVAVGDLAVS